MVPIDDAKISQYCIYDCRLIEYKPKVERACYHKEKNKFAELHFQMTVL